MTKRYGQCLTVGCHNEASFDVESHSYFSHCFRCAELSGYSSGVVHMHGEYLGNGKWTERHDVTAVPMGVSFIGESARLISFTCGRCNAVQTYDLDDYLTGRIEAWNDAAYRRSGCAA